MLNTSVVKVFNRVGDFFAFVECLWRRLYFGSDVSEVC